MAVSRAAVGVAVIMEDTEKRRKREKKALRKLPRHQKARIRRMQSTTVNADEQLRVDAWIREDGEEMKFLSDTTTWNYRTSKSRKRVWLAFTEVASDTTQISDLKVFNSLNNVLGKHCKKTFDSSGGLSGVIEDCCTGFKDITTYVIGVFPTNNLEWGRLMSFALLLVHR